MNMKEFTAYVVSHVKEYLPEEYRNMPVQTWEQLKTNGQVYHALTLKPDRIMVMPVLYLENYFEVCLYGQNKGETVEESMEHVLKQMGEKFVNALHEAVHYLPSVETGILNLEDVKEYVWPVVVNYEHNKEMLKLMPHEKVLDLAVSYRLLFGEASIVISMRLMEFWGIHKEELGKIAMENLYSATPEIAKFSSFLDSKGFAFDQNVALYMVSNKGY